MQEQAAGHRFHRHNICQDFNTVLLGQLHLLPDKFLSDVGGRADDHRTPGALREGADSGIHSGGQRPQDHSCAA